MPSADALRESPPPAARESIRPVAPEDADAVAAFFAETHRLDPVVGAFVADDWRRFVAMPQNDAGREFRLATVDGTIAGVATPSLRMHESPWIRHFSIVVLPPLRRRGIASRLLRQVAELAAAEPVVLQCLCPERWDGMAGFLDTSGFAVIETELEMLCDGAGEDAPEPRRDLVIRTIADPAPLAEKLAAIHNRANAGTSSFVRLTGPEMLSLFGDAAAVLVAELNGAVVGFCHLAPGPSASWIENVAVDPGRQRRGIGTSLVASALAEASQRGAPAVHLSVSDRNAAAYVVYRRAGFRVVGKSARYRGGRDAVLAALAARGR